jgi:hypothetical protein
MVRGLLRNQLIVSPYCERALFCRWLDVASSDFGVWILERSVPSTRSTSHLRLGSIDNILDCFPAKVLVLEPMVEVRLAGDGARFQFRVPCTSSFQLEGSN